MEVKKSPKADLEGKKQISLLMGYVIALAVLFVAFEWGTRDIEVSKDTGVADVIAEEEIEITRPEEIPPPALPPPVVVTPEILNVVEDDIVVETEILSSEDAADAAQVETYTPPAVVEEEEEDPNQVFVIVEKTAEFPGGSAAMYAFINKTMRYPQIAMENGIKGRVTCEFIVNKDGKIVDAKVIKGVDPSLDKEALRVISMMPPWSPGEQRGKPVRSKFTLPITFKLQ